MRSVRTAAFLRHYRKLDCETRKAARIAFRQWQADPEHPGLNFKEVRGRKGVFSCRVGLEHRALCRKEEDRWAWIGAHDEYDSLLRGKGRTTF